MTHYIGYNEMKIIVTGSVALNHHISDVKIGHDIDYIMTYEDYKTFKDSLEVGSILSVYPINKGKTMVIKTSDDILEIEIAWKGSTAEDFMNLVLIDPKTKLFMEGTKYACYIPSLDALYAMKMSHRYLRNSPHFLKTMKHIHLMREHGVTKDVNDHWYDWYERRMEETYWYIHPNLNTTKDDFFKDESFYKYDHDDIHESVMLGDRPAYTRILADNSPVKCDRAKFNALPFEHKLACGLEECYVLALERSQIPNDFEPNSRKSFEVALMKVCTSITSGWFREWCWEHYNDIANAYDPSYVPHFQTNLALGLIKPFKSDNMYKH